MREYQVEEGVHEGLGRLSWIGRSDRGVCYGEGIQARRGVTDGWQLQPSNNKQIIVPGRNKSWRAQSCCCGTEARVS